MMRRSVAALARASRAALSIGGARTAAQAPRHPSRRQNARSALAWSAIACCVLAVHASSSGRVRADERTEPGRVLGLASAGVPMRLTVDESLGQSRFAPFYGNVLAGYVLPGTCLRHGFGLSFSWNFGHDGGYTEPVYAADQFVLMPSYLAYYTLNTDFFAIGRAGLPILVRGGPSVGLEVGAAIAYRIFAGTGVFAALNLDGFVGIGVNLLASLELGVVIDYEVLP